MDAIREIDVNKDHQVVQGFVLGQVLLNLGIIDRIYLGKVCKPNKVAYWKLRKIAWSCEELEKKFGQDGIDTVHHVLNGEFDSIKIKCCFIKRLTKDVEELRNTDFFDNEEKEEVFAKLKAWSGENIREYVKNFSCTTNAFYRMLFANRMKEIYKGQHARDGFAAPFSLFCDSLSDEIKEKFLIEFNVDLEKIEDFSEFMQKMYTKDNLTKMCSGIRLGHKGRNITSLSYDIRELQRRIALAKKKGTQTYKSKDVQEMECMLEALLAQREALVSGLEEDRNVSYMTFDIDSDDKKVCDFVASCLKNGFRRFVRTKKCSFDYTLGYEEGKSRFFVVFPTKHPMTKICTKNSEDNIFKIFSTLMDAVSDKFGRKIKMSRMGRIAFLS